MAPAGRATTPGLYDSRFEHDACGVGFIADLTGRPGHDVVSKALTALCNLQHRGAEGGDPGTGDGAGILTQIPDAFFREVCDFDLPLAGSYAAGLVFLDKETAGGKRPRRPSPGSPRPRTWSSSLARRPAPPGGLRPRRARRTAPPRAALPGRYGRQRGMELERMAFCLRKRPGGKAACTSRACRRGPSCTRGCCRRPRSSPSFRTCPTSGTGPRWPWSTRGFSTNTFPSWQLAHPYRYIAHNGEINTVRGNRNWMRAREAMLASSLIPDSADGRGIDRVFPALDPAGSDSASFDECLELLHMGGRSLPHAILMMIPSRGRTTRRWTRRAGPSTSSTRR